MAMSEKNKVLLVMSIVAFVLLGVMLTMSIVYGPILDKSQAQVYQCLDLLHEKEEMLDECMCKLKRMHLALRYNKCRELVGMTPERYQGGISDFCFDCTDYVRDHEALTVESCELFLDCVLLSCDDSGECEDACK